MIAGRFVTMAYLRLDGAATLHAALMDITRFAAAGFQDDATLLVVAIA